MKKWLLVLLFPTFCFAQKTSLTRILFILDASNSMNSTWDKQTRLEGAKEVLLQAMEQFKEVPNIEIALRIYGHQTPITNDTQDCNDTKLEVPFSVGNIDVIKNKIRGLVAKGATPIARSLEAAAGDFPDTLARNVIILITDGLESCDNNPCVIAKKLREKGVKVTPFVIGLGMDLSYLENFSCIGTYSDAEDKDSFKNVLITIIGKILTKTSVQFNLNDILQKPTETNVTLFLYEAGTQNLKYTFTHTINRYANPDTLVMDPSLKYDLVVNTLPKIEKKGISLIRNTHNTFQVDAAQGFLKFQGANLTSIRIMEKGKFATINVQSNNSQDKYLVGFYDLEILTLPRTYQRIEISQSKTTVVAITAPGSLELKSVKFNVGQVFVDKGNGIVEWVFNLDEKSLTSKHVLQPGNYKVVYRQKDQKSTGYTQEKKFKIESTKKILLTL
jgi:Ca-activated chloride channel family protein